MRVLQLFIASMLVTGCSSVPAPVRATPKLTTGVFVNGEELVAADKARLDALLGYKVPAGRYFVDAAGKMGVEGQHWTVDLVSRGC